MPKSIPNCVPDKAQWINQERRRWARYFSVPIVEKNAARLSGPNCGSPACSVRHLEKGAGTLCPSCRGALSVLLGRREWPDRTT